ncbi:hypothetical protein [Chryseobacterium fistulae]|nr:hypothetical protein [Chryseobacterium fistulae]
MSEAREKGLKVPKKKE